MIIAISGKARTGKSTLAAMLTGFVFVESPISGELKRTFPQCDMPKEEWRKILIDGGKELRDEHGGDYLLKEMLKNKNDNIVIPDLRLKDELNYLKERDDVIFIRLYVHRDYHPYRFKNDQEYLDYLAGAAKDETETDLDNVSNRSWNHIIDNSGSLSYLQKRADEIIGSL